MQDVNNGVHWWGRGYIYFLLNFSAVKNSQFNKETVVLNDTLDHLDLIDIYRTFHLKKPEYIFFSSAHGTFSRIDHMLGHKTSLNKFKKIEIISSIFPTITV